MHRPLIPTSLLLLLLSITLPSPIIASQGDHSRSYQNCLATCLPTCPSPPPFTVWSCPANCAYDCTTALTNLALDFNPRTLDPGELARLKGRGGELDGLEVGRMVQFYGKWPFKRYLGTQEILSVLFSIGNFISHYRGRKVLRKVGISSPEGKMLRNFYVLNALVGMNTWVWSSVFHTRDLGWTEKADYFSATAAMLYGLWLVIARLGGLYRRKRKSTRYLTIMTCSAALFFHCAYLTMATRFDYTYNMKFNLLVGLSSIILWLLWSLFHSSPSPSPLPSSSYISPSPRKTSRLHLLKLTQQHPRAPHHLLPLLPLSLLFSCTLLEVLDFAPVPSSLRLLDAHALWHLSTIPVIRMWYGFLVTDLEWVEERESGRDRMGGTSGLGGSSGVESEHGHGHAGGGLSEKLGRGVSPFGGRAGVRERDSSRSRLE